MSGTFLILPLFFTVGSRSTQSLSERATLVLEFLTQVAED